MNKPEEFYLQSIKSYTLKVFTGKRKELAVMTQDLVISPFFSFLVHSLENSNKHIKNKNKISNKI